MKHRIVDTECPDGYIIGFATAANGRLVRRATVRRCRRIDPKARVQDSYHGAGRYSVQVFGSDGRLLADQRLT